MATIDEERRSYVRGDFSYKVKFRIMAPVSVRTEDEKGTLGNRVAMWLMALPIAEEDPAKRIQAVAIETRNLKETDQALGASTLVQVSTGAPATVVSLAARLASRVRPFNMTVTNVPGPQFPMYLAGSQMLATYPMSIRPLRENIATPAPWLSHSGTSG